VPPPQLVLADFGLAHPLALEPVSHRASPSSRCQFAPKTLTHDKTDEKNAVLIAAPSGKPSSSIPSTRALLQQSSSTRSACAPAAAG
jgi:hypothetical protein